jgi:hypothetical protein
VTRLERPPCPGLEQLIHAVGGKLHDEVALDDHREHLSAGLEADGAEHAPLLERRVLAQKPLVNGLPEPEQQAIFAEYMAIRQAPGVLDGNQLQPTDTATTVRVHDGQTETTRRTGVDETAALDGYYLYETQDLESAIAMAARIPAARMGGTVEVRPVIER